MIQKIRLLVTKLFINRGNPQSKFNILNFFCSGENQHPIIYHTQKVAKHLGKHHKKYLRGSLLSFGIIKLFLVYFATAGLTFNFTFAQGDYSYSLGNGSIEKPYEMCDDANIENGDGCDGNGFIEDGYSCIGEPSICADFGISKTDGPALDFLVNNIDDQDIINTYYGVKSAYTSTRDNNNCKTGDISIVHIQPGEDTIPRYLSSNTIYLLENGDYISSTMIDITGSCIALVGLDQDVKLFTNKTKGANIKISEGKNIIIDNLNLYGEDDGKGGFHTGNNYGIFIDTTDNTIYKINAYGYLGFGVYMEDFQNNISEIKLFKTASIKLYPQYDTYINGNENDNLKNYGISRSLVADSKGSKFLIKFDLSNIPQLSNVLRASIRLTKIGGKSNTVKIRKILNNSRIEGNSDGIVPIYGEPNYTHLSYPDKKRNGGEGSFSSADYDENILVDQISFSKKNSTQQFGFNSYGIQSLQEYINNPDLNQGFVFIADVSSIAIASKENGYLSDIPQLTIEYRYEDLNTQNNPVILPRTTNSEIVKQIMITNGYIETSGNLVGTKPINLSLSKGNLPISVSIESIEDKTIVELSQNIKIKTQSGLNYTGTIKGPKNISTSTFKDGKISNQIIIKAFKIGSDKEKLLIENNAGDKKKVNITVPIVGYDVGSEIIINYSNDGEIWNTLGTTTVKENSGVKYIQFQTNHFTQFIVSKKDCSFVINQDETLTSQLDVTLQTTCDKPLSRMRFSNTADGLSNADWINFQSEYQRKIAGDIGLNTVYVEFDNNKNGKTFLTSDDIEYNNCDPLIGCSTVVISPTNDSEIIKNELIAEGYKDIGDKVEGSTSIDLSDNDGILLTPVVLESVDKKIKVEIPQDTKFIKESDSKSYLGTIIAPKESSITDVQKNQPNEKIIKAFKVGSTTESVSLQNVKTTDTITATIIVPLDVSYIGKSIDVSYSQDSINWSHLTTVTAQDDFSGGSYVQFDTTHFTVFSLAEAGECSFVINKDEPTTSTIDVTLETSCDKGMPISMIIANTREEVRADIEGGKRMKFISPYKGWMLDPTPDPGTHTVYAAFTDGATTEEVSDDIDLDSGGPIIMPECGNAKIEDGEDCDDGNTIKGDGCSNTCKRETQSSSCTGLPANTTANTAIGITQTCGASNGY
ncbi:MAG: DUF4215 domain-containing protein, partial [Candidatus Absconditicoccaceae bacterium]